MAVLHTNGEDYQIGLDGIYRISPGAGGAPAVGTCGYWKDEDTFVIEYMLVGTTTESQAKIDFIGERLKTLVRERVFGGIWSMDGSAESP